MKKKTEQELIARAVTDPHFRKTLLADPEQAIASEEYDVSPEMLAEIKKAVTMTPAAVNAAIESAAREGGAGL
jgi:Ribosomally synthesized peptide prototyped by Frankia Franean1_4349.